ncbi:Voldacs domain-containing protein [Sporobolomyces salmoneus]|uniref:Voldacs domain-containing protein n=1 Tax=Sporobolomyces salmoneus TaxID=183962 RepID=UPI0031795633
MAITLLTSPPPALTPPELQDLSQSTPASFEGIAPLLRHFEEEVEIRVEPAFEGFAGGKGNVYITEEALSFFSTSTSTGISFPYPHITLHAVSRASSIPSAATTNGDSNGTEPTTSNGGPCLYCQLEESEQIDDSDDGSGTREMWIVPKQEENLEKIFSSLSYCASLHPPSHSGEASVLSESQSAQQSSQASMFASMGLDPDSMVYADENGQLAGPGLALLDGEGVEGQWEDVEEGQEESTGGRQRSDYVNPGRRAPY